MSDARKNARKGNPDSDRNLRIAYSTLGASTVFLAPWMGLAAANNWGWVGFIGGFLLGEICPLVVIFSIRSLGMRQEHKAKKKAEHEKADND